MAKCLRCGAANEWISGGRAPKDYAAEVENNELRAENKALRQALGWMRDAAVHGPDPSDAELQEVDRLLTPNAAAKAQPADTNG